MIAGVGPDAEQCFSVPHPATLVKDLTGFVHLGRLPGVVEDGSVAHGYGGIGALGVQIGIYFTESLVTHRVKYIWHLMTIIPISTAVVIHEKEGISRRCIEQHRFYLMHACLPFHEDGRDLFCREVDLPQGCQVLLIDTIDDFIALIVNVEFKPPGVLKLGLLKRSVDNARRVGLRVYFPGQRIHLQGSLKCKQIFEGMLLDHFSVLALDPDHHIAPTGPTGYHRTDLCSR
ncbi:hypothetical protein SDC9_157480 [bioreactor metagenome]|uniref:Uncharacterized protein n=1 Tax=bioreactor metagenome TaxID=1076179 RepID=A0A645F732_9ZZZZ